MYKLPESMKNKYSFVTLASKRAEQLQMGAPARVAADPDRKWTVVAQEEVALGLVEQWDPAQEEIEVEGGFEEEEEE